MPPADLSTPDKARAHARAQAGTNVRAMPTIPASAAKDLPAGVAPADVVWDETMAAGEYGARVLRRGTRLRITNVAADGCASLIALNADRPIERLNVADTIKVQWNAYLGAGKLLLSDMGRVLLSITAERAGRMDSICGASTEASNARRYGSGETHGRHPNARDRFMIALAKYGLGRRDIPPNVNFFKAVTVGEDGGLRFGEAPGAAGDFVELRAEMNVLVAMANTPHVLDPRPRYTCSDVRVTAWRGPVTPPDDPIRTASPESVRAFENVEDYFLS